MAQPDFVPLNSANKVRAPETLPVPQRWTPDRPGELTGMRPPEGDRFGTAGPDQGYGLKLARSLVHRLQLEPGEHAEDVVAGAMAIGTKRAALFGRGPVVYDFELAYTLFGFLGRTTPEMVQYRRELFDGAHHHYWRQRLIADLVPDKTLRLTPAQVADQLSEWKLLLDFDAAP